LSWELNVTHVVTGAFGYTGKYIARRLLDAGSEVRTLTGHPDRPDPFEGRVSALPLDFDSAQEMRRALDGADTLFNTYWIRFAKGELTHQRAVRDIRALIQAAEEAGVRRIVHVSITNATRDSPLPYFRGKAEVEDAIRQSGLSYAILRPTLIFGIEDILTNNIAWLLRRFPMHPIFGSGQYRVQPIFVDDLARLAVKMGERNDNVALDAVGPEVFTYEAMVRLIATKIGARSTLVHVNPRLAMLASKLMGLLVRDVVLTKDELDGLTADLLVSKPGEPPPGATRLSDWLDTHASELGARYASELDRHYK
jgi:NADH dehydrogenase